MKIQPENIRRAFQAFDWKTLFLEELLWNKPRAVQPPIVNGVTVSEVAHLGQIPVYEITTGDSIPDTPTRRNIHLQISKTTANCLLIFVDKARTQTLWLWAKREKSRFVYRESIYLRGQSGDLFLSKIAALFVDIAGSVDGTPVSALQAGRILRNALDVSAITKKFYGEFKEVQLEIAPLIQGLPDDKTRARYTLVLLHRLMFIYFLQKRRFIDDNLDYLEDKLNKYGDGKNGFFEVFLKPLFFQGFAKPDRTPELRALIGEVRYLNGGLFLKHKLEEDFDIEVPEVVFDKLFGVFKGYDWYATDDRDTSKGLLSPELLGFIFEKFINDQKSAGAYYTPEALTSYLCERTIEDLILDDKDIKAFGKTHGRRAESIFDLIGHADKNMCGLIWKRLSTLRVLDPAVGSGAFLVAAFYTLEPIYTQLWSRAGALNLNGIQREMLGDDASHANEFYAMRRRIITHNLYGVDLMEGAPEIARLRLFLALVSSVDKKEDLEPLPNIDFNILEGNSLIGYLHSEDLPSQSNSGQITLGDMVWNVTVISKQDELERYMSGELTSEEAAESRDRINNMREKDAIDLADTMLQNFNGLKIQFESKGSNGKTVKRPLTVEDINKLRPFHWAYEFPNVMKSGGFDAIITNPPWEVFETNEKEFTQRYDDTIKKKKIRIEDWNKQFKTWLKDPEFAAAWDDYEQSFPHVSAYFKKSAYYRFPNTKNGEANYSGKLNLQFLFLQRCFALLNQNGRCGIVIPSGIYTDLGAKRLREMLFEQSEITGLFGFENRRTIFEGVDSRFKFVALSLVKGKNTKSFPAAFMRHDVNELATFPSFDSYEMSVPTIKEFSPDSYSMFELNSVTDESIVRKMLQSPLLGDEANSTWKVAFTQEINMTTGSYLFKDGPATNRVQLYEGKMMHQFTHKWSEGSRWLEEKEARTYVLGRKSDSDQDLPYQHPRLAYRSIARNTDSRTMIASILPPRVFCGHSLNVCNTLEPLDALYVSAVLNSFAFDWMLRLQTTANLTMFFIYNIPVPRLAPSDTNFRAIITRAAKLICTTAEFDNLARIAKIGSHRKGVIDEGERAILRAELDALVAHLYNLNEEEFERILSTFTLALEPAKLAARNKFRDIERGVFIP